MYFDVNGNYLKTEHMDKYYSNISADKNFVYLYYPTYSNAVEPDYTILAVDKKTGKRYDILPFGEEYAPFCKRGNKMTNQNTSTFFTRKLDDSVYELRKGKLYKKFILNFGEMAFPRDKIDHKYGCMDIELLCSKNKWIYTIFDILQVKDKLVFSTNLDGMGIFDEKDNIISYYKFFNVTRYGVPSYNSRYICVEGATSGICIVEYPQDLAAIRKSQEKLLNKTTISEEDTNPNGNPTLLLYSN